MSGIVWLASYPKSGNTWLRAFLTNFYKAGDGPADINRLIGIRHASRTAVDNALGVDSSALTEAELVKYRREAFRKLATEASEALFVKIHDAYATPDGVGSPIPADVSLGAIYVVRNPLDVAVSFAHHGGTAVDRTIRCMAQPDYALSGDPSRLFPGLKQYVSSWSRHVGSWLDQREIPVHVVRYEEMCSRPVEAFTGVLRFLGIPEDGDRLRRAIAFSAFEILQSQECEKGFIEKPPTAQRFFRNGRSGDWNKALAGDQVSRIVSDHAAAMRRLNYLKGDGSV